MGRAEQYWNSNILREVDIPKHAASEKSSYHKELDMYSVQLIDAIYYATSGGRDVLETQWALLNKSQ